MKKSIISLLFLFQVISVFALSDSTAVVYDSSNVELRSFDEEKIEEYKSEYDYGTGPKEGLSWWDRFIYWLGKLISKLFYLGTTTPFGKIIIYFLCGAVIIYAILKYLKLDVRQIFFSGTDKGNLEYNVFEEDIHEMDFEKLIQEAIDQHEYRNAIRLIYLYSLRNLSDHHLIDWKPGKTNHDYIYEVEDQNLRTGFSQLSFYFDYAWYGDFKINQQLFDKVNNIYSNWKGNLPK
ncbi:MAG: hypothetical protein AAFN93_17655 [Bacteroidota bacterium]